MSVRCSIDKIDKLCFADPNLGLLSIFFRDWTRRWGLQNYQRSKRSGQKREETMTITIDLSPDEEQRLQATARKQGKQPAEVLTVYVRALPDDASEPVEEMTWGARIAARMKEEDVFGVFDDRPEDSPKLARLIRARAEKRIYSP